MEYKRGIARRINVKGSLIRRLSSPNNAPTICDLYFRNQFSLYNIQLLSFKIVFLGYNEAYIMAIQKSKLLEITNNDRVFKNFQISLIHKPEDPP
jgi:hypothetical protein